MGVLARGSETDRPQRLLIVDDDQDIRDTLAEILQDEGFEVMTASNGSDALARLAAAPERPDVILLDLTMPVMDGFEFRNAQLADERIADIPVILITAGGGNVRLAGLPVATKPFDTNALLAAIRQLC